VGSETQHDLPVNLGLQEKKAREKAAKKAEKERKKAEKKREKENKRRAKAGLPSLEEEERQQVGTQTVLMMPARRAALCAL
jgi:hypothetical protein